MVIFITQQIVQHIIDVCVCACIFFSFFFVSFRYFILSVVDSFFSRRSITQSLCVFSLSLSLSCPRFILVFFILFLLVFFTLTQPNFQVYIVFSLVFPTTFFPVLVHYGRRILCTYKHTHTHMYMDIFIWFHAQSLAFDYCSVRNRFVVPLALVVNRWMLETSIVLSDEHYS